MKLFNRYNRISILASILALLLGSIAYYFVIHYTLIRQLDNTLRVEEAEILSFVRSRDRLPEPANYRDQQISFTPATVATERRFHDTAWQASRHHNVRPFRQLLFSVVAGGKTFTVSVSKSEVETEDLLEWIMLISAAMIGLLLGILFLANRLLLRRIWQPFYETMEKMRRFHLSSRQPLLPRDTGVDEFTSLEAEVALMTRKILKDYDMLKNFADNASHEMQTPLAIINSRLDLILQDPVLGERHVRQLQAMYDAVGRLRQLNQSLLLLTKIENNQFPQTSPVELGALVSEKLMQLEDLVRERALVVRTDLDRGSVPMNAYLADILLNNLIVNAIRHNISGGSLDIRLRGEGLSIRNTGPVLQFEASVIFDRFVKGGQSEGTGLGLAIVKQICDNYGFGVAYGYTDGLHSVEIRFASASEFPQNN
jgi:signal transduction histidine kinase